MSSALRRHFKRAPDAAGVRPLAAEGLAATSSS